MSRVKFKHLKGGAEGNTDNPFCITENTDFLVSVENQKLFLHSPILSVYSPVLKEIISKRNSNSEPLEEIIQNSTPLDVIEFFRFFYPNHKQKIPGLNDTEGLEVIENVLRLSEDYKCYWLSEQIDKLLLDEAPKTLKTQTEARVLNIDRFTKDAVDSKGKRKLHLLLLTDQFNMKKSHQYILKRLSSQTLETIMMTDDFGNLKKDTVLKLLMARISLDMNHYVRSAYSVEEKNAVCETLDEICCNNEDNVTDKEGQIFPNNRLKLGTPPDISVKVEDQILHLHSDILCHYSPVFNAMLRGNFKESTSKEIELKYKKAKPVAEMFSFLYADKSQSLSKQTSFKELIPLCQEYQIKWLAKEIEDYLALNLDALDHVAGLLLAEQYNLEKYKENLISVGQLKEMRNSNEEKFQHLSNHIKYRLIKKSYMKIRPYKTNPKEQDLITQYLDSFFHTKK